MQQVDSKPWDQLAEAKLRVNSYAQANKRHLVDCILITSNTAPLKQGPNQIHLLLDVNRKEHNLTAIIELEDKSPYKNTGADGGL